MNPVVDVAAAILVRPDGAVLLAQRPAGKVYGGWWEFPGGKVEPGEAPLHTLARELREELGVEVAQAFPWVTRMHTYAHATVRLHFFRVLSWRGVPHGREGQAFAWQRLDALSVGPVLPANGPVMKGLALPAEYAVSDATALGDAPFLAALARRLEGGLRLVQLREKGMARDRLAALGRQMLDLARSHAATVLVNGDEGLARELGAHGVHLPEADLAARTARPDFEWVGASVHSVAALRRAESLGADFVVLGPIRPTASHPGDAPLGWDGFERIAGGAGVPVFAIGGLVPRDLESAWSRGAHGVAMIRGAWEEREGGRGKGEG